LYEIAERLEEGMLNLEDEPRPRGPRKLKGRDAYRIRTGDYRFVYFIDDKLLTVTVIKVGHRKDIYR
jgi:mRNA interferase RelE/StbE